MDIALEDVALNGIGSPPPADSAEPSKVASKAEAGNQAQFPSSVGAQLVGQVVGLLTQSQAHRHLFLADLEWLIGPPMALRQFRLFHDGKQPVAVAFWALVSDEVEKELLARRTRLKPGEWKSGDNLWIVDVVAPSIVANPKALQSIISQVGHTAFGDRKFKTRLLDLKTGMPRIVEMTAMPTAKKQ